MFVIRSIGKKCVMSLNLMTGKIMQKPIPNKSHITVELRSFVHNRLIVSVFANATLLCPSERTR